MFTLQTSDKGEDGVSWSVLKDDYMKTSSAKEDWRSDEERDISDQDVPSNSDSELSG